MCVTRCWPGWRRPEYGYDVDDAVRRLAGPGYHNMETGFTRLDKRPSSWCPV